MAKKNSSDTIPTNVELITDPTLDSHENPKKDLEVWFDSELFPKGVEKYALEYFEKIMEEITDSKKVKDSKASQEELLEFLKNRADSSDGNKKATELIEFILKNKSKLLGIISTFEEKTFRQARELIDNKLNGERLVKEQPTLFDKLEEESVVLTPEKVVAPTINGLDLSPAEDRLIHTISLLLSRKSERYDQSSSKYFMGNYEKGLINIDSIEVETARMIISPHELYSTYYGRNNYNSDHIQFLLNVLKELSKKSFQITLNLPSKTSTDKKKKFDKLRTFLPLYQIAILNYDLTESESQEIDNNELLMEGKKCHFLFKFGPLFTNNIRDRYVEFPEDIHLRITNAKAAGAKGRIPQCVNLMRDLLFREKQLGRFQIERDEEKLVHTLGLSKEWNAGKKSRVQERLTKSFEIFKEIGLLKTVEETLGSRGQKKYQIELNKDFK